jgi:3-oxoacyl-[acyl-carrier protein] reductase
MDLRLGGKAVLITGGSKGIGFACAAGFAAEGCRIHIAARNDADLQAARKRITDSYQVEVVCHACDLTSTDAVIALGRECNEVDILVNNAGSIGRARIDQIDPQGWRRAWDLKVFGYIDLAREIYSGMRARGSGVIINIIGLSGERHRPEFIAGTSGNAALMAFTRALGAESVDFGVRVVGVNPGRVETERQIEHLHEAAQKVLGDRNRWRDMRAQMVEGLPFKRSARPDEVADLVVFLASERASYMSATVVTIDAGQSLRPRAPV